MPPPCLRCAGADLTVDAGALRCERCAGQLLVDGSAQEEFFGKLRIDAALVAEIAQTGRDGPTCPSCAGSMKTFSLKGVEVDRCSRCSAIWLDDDEQKRIEGAAPAPTQALSAEQIEARAKRRAAERRNPSYGGHLSSHGLSQGLDGQAGGWSPTTAQLVLLTLGGALMVLAGLSVFLVGEMPAIDTQPYEMDEGPIEGGGAYFMGALLLGGGLPMILIPWLKRAQAKADSAWEDFSDSLD